MQLYCRCVGAVPWQVARSHASRIQSGLPLYAQVCGKSTILMWISLTNSLRLQSSNLRDLLLKFLHQARATKGYDVDLYFDFIAHPYTVFVPRNLLVDDEKFYNRAMAAAKFAICKINSRMMWSGKSYEVEAPPKR